MTGLEPNADQVVREAVDAYLDGWLQQNHLGEMVFETKNSRYRLMDGTLFDAPDTSLLGAELVGWLMDEQRPVMESAWQPGARAVLVDRKRGRHIIVTSATRMLHLEDRSSGSGLIQAGSARPPTPVPPPPQVAPIPRPLPIPARPPLHMPPRPIARPPVPTPPPRAIAAPLPFPTPPPPRPAQPGAFALPKVQPPPRPGVVPPPVEDADNLEVTEEEQQPLPLVRQQHTLLRASSFERGALLR